MNYFLNFNKTFLTYFLILVILIPIFGLQFLISFLGNVLLLLILIPLLLFLLVYLGFNSYKSKINICNNCGALSLNLSNKCVSCGADLKDTSQKNQFDEKPSESTIEVKAEEIK